MCDCLSAHTNDLIFFNVCVHEIHSMRTYMHVFVVCVAIKVFSMAQARPQTPSYRTLSTKTNTRVTIKVSFKLDTADLW